MDQQQIFDISSKLLTMSPFLYALAVIIVLAAVHHYLSSRSETSCEAIGPLMWIGVAVFLVMLGTP